jgi:uncharacterized DUF497 family protein
MRYAWDPVKDAINRQKHGLPLESGVPALHDPDRISGLTTGTITTKNG